jgi:hypothetical protein
VWVARARRRWIRKQGLLGPARLVFIDETATSTSLVRLRGRCPRGERLVGTHGHWKTITLVVGLRHDGMVAPFVIDGPMNGTIFLAYVEQCLAPTLDRRDVVIMDNLPAHKVASVTDAIEAVGATAFYCHRIHLISTRSSRSSANSKRFCERPPDGGIREELTAGVAPHGPGRYIFSRGRGHRAARLILLTTLFLSTIDSFVPTECVLALIAAFPWRQSLLASLK